MRSLTSGITHSQGGTLFQSLDYIYNVDRVASMGRGEGDLRWHYRYDGRSQAVCRMPAPPGRVQAAWAGWLGLSWLQTGIAQTLGSSYHA